MILHRRETDTAVLHRDGTHAVAVDTGKGEWVATRSNDAGDTTSNSPQKGLPKRGNKRGHSGTFFIGVCDSVAVTNLNYSQHFCLID